MQNRKRHPHTEEYKQYMSQLQQGQHNGMWKGDDAGYKAIHIWVRSHSQIPNECTKCGKNRKLEASNISGKYKRDLSDWEYLCRSCHRIKDTSVGYQICSICGTDKTYIKHNGRPYWGYISGKIVCHNCYYKDYYRRKKSVS